MSLEIVKVETENLSIGMYVSKLDRPWLDTPFLLQGFPIKTNDDISELKKYCSHVFIDIDKGDELDYQYAQQNVEHEKITIKKQKDTNTKNLNLDNIFVNNSKNKQIKGRYIDKTSFIQELPQAEKSFQKSSDQISHVMLELKESGKLDLVKLNNSVEPMIDSVLRNRDAMAWLCLMKKKDNYIYNHSVSSSIWAMIFGRHLGFDQDSLQTLSLGAMLLDIGKTKIPNELLNKLDPLTEDELKLMRKHVEFGLNILEQTPKVHNHIKQMVETHHERHNGSGYPKGLAGHKIPVYGRIAAIIDSFDAMTSRRPYAKQISTYDCLRLFNKVTNIDFQSEMVKQFIQAIGFFPTGTLVELSDGAVGIVVKQNYSLRLRPQVMLILDKNKNMKNEFPIVSLDDDDQSECTNSSLWITKGLEPGAHGINPEDFFLQSQTKANTSE